MKRNLLEICGKVDQYAIYKMPRSMRPANQKKRYFVTNNEFSDYFYDHMTEDVKTVDDCIDYLQKEIIDRYHSIDKFFYTETEAYYYLQFIKASTEARILKSIYENAFKEAQKTFNYDDDFDIWQAIDNAPFDE